jgi:hypothetical protein
MSIHGYTSISLCLPDECIERLNVVARETGRSIEDLAECAVEEAALESAKSRGYRGGNER